MDSIAALVEEMRLAFEANTASEAGIPEEVVDSMPVYVPRAAIGWPDRLEALIALVFDQTWKIEGVAMGDPPTRSALKPVATALRSIAGGDPK